jgi:hypothetical protein
LLTTSVSLLHRLRTGTDARGWERFVRLYAPLLLRWARLTGARDADAADLVQDVLALLFHKLPPLITTLPAAFAPGCRPYSSTSGGTRAAHPARSDTLALNAVAVRNEDSEEREDR